jgi:hypothetical protein
VSKAVVLVVRGTDLLGQPFEERTSTIALNLQGCRYASKHHLPKNTWVTLELPQGPEHRSMRARVAWIQRPHSVREFFQIAVELESPANIWNIDSTPADWKSEEASAPQQGHVMLQDSDKNFENSNESPAAPETNAPVEEQVTSNMETPSWNFASDKQSEGTEQSAETSPLLRQWNAEMERQVNLAAEMATTRAAGEIREAIEQFQREQDGARLNFSTEITARQQEFLNELNSQFERSANRSRELIEDLERTAEALRAEKEAALESAQARLQTEATDTARAQQQPADPSNGAVAVPGEAAATWREHLDSEMSRAKAQWDELLQSSLDSGVEHLVGELSRRSEEILRGSEQKLTERMAEMRQPLAQLQSEARDAVSGLKPALDEELARAQASLAEMEHAAARVKEYSAQLDAASHDTLDELHRRLENILQTQTDEMNRRAETLVAGVTQRFGPTLDTLGNHLVERVTQEVETSLAPRLKRASELIHQLSARELEAEESLRLHRERLRQTSENNQREAVAQMADTLGRLRGEFESARQEALARWNEELDAAGIRASHTAAESIGRSSEWFQQEARARLQVLTEQALATAAAGVEEKTAEAGRQFEVLLETQSARQLLQVHERIEVMAGEVAGRTSTEFERASEAAAASFGQVLHNISEQEVAQFLSDSRGVLEQRQQEVKQFASELLVNLETSAGSAIDRFHTQMASELETSVTEGRRSLAAEFASALSGYRDEREAYHEDWIRVLDRAADEAAEKYQQNLQTASDSWVVSSVRRLNERGQEAIDNLMRSADQAMRDSCSKLFGALSELLRERSGSPSGPAGFGGGPHSGEAASARGANA